MTQTEHPPLHPLLRIEKSFSNPDVGYWDGANRERTDDDHEDWLIDGLLPIGASVLYADPGTGKSYLTLAMIHHLIYGRPLGPWGTEGPGRALCWVLDLEGTWKMTQDRGYTLTPYGELPADGDAERADNWCFWSGEVIPWAELEAWKTIPRQAQRHVQYLAKTLDEAEAAGAPIRFVVIDTLTKFAGPRPRTASGNAYEYEAALVDALNRVALAHRCAVLLIHHTNKAGEISGSTGIGGSAIVTMRLDVEDQDDEDRDAGKERAAVLKSTKVRIGAPFCYSLVQRADGVWEFIDQPPSAAVARGHARTVLFQLAEHSRGCTYGELLRSTGLGESLRTTLYRLKRRREVISRHGRWQLAQTDVRSVPGQVDALCASCGGPMSVLTAGQTTHPGCEVTAPDQSSTDPGPNRTPTDEAPAAAPDTAAPPPDEGDSSDVSRETVTALAVLKTSIMQSRMHPVLFIKAEHRTTDPWPLVTEQMTGEHRWVHPVAADVPAGTPVTVLDRNGSDPSAMSSVIVVANLMRHTGPMRRRGREDGKPQAGLFQIAVPAWDAAAQGIGHPLGRLAERGELVWVTTPHMTLLERLADEGVIPLPPILDSWTGRGTGGLFSKFSAFVRDERKRTFGSPEYAQVKERTSIAVRSLWPKGARSPFWRPDWSVSVRAEAAVRHWIRAREATQGGAVLLRLGAVDEAVFVGSSVPAPYREDVDRTGGYGLVKRKAVTVDAEDWPSPLPVEVWRQSVRSLRTR